MINRILILLLGPVLGAWAQLPPVGSPEVYWRMNPGTSVNEVSIRQAGADHQGTIAILAGQQNQIGLTQMGNSHRAEMQVTGQLNQISVLQTGERNRLMVGLSGSNNQLKINQDGGDAVSLAGLTATNAGIDIIQKSGHNTLIAEGMSISPAVSTGGVANLKIEQSGGSTVRVQYGPAMSQ